MEPQVVAPCNPRAPASIPITFRHLERISVLLADPGQRIPSTFALPATLKSQFVISSPSPYNRTIDYSISKQSAIQVRVTNKIFTARGQRVLLDAELATLYRVTTANLHKATQRNAKRFPQDFIFQLTKKEMRLLLFQSGIAKVPRHGGRRHLPTPSPSKALPCSRAFYAVLAPCKCAKCCLPTKNYAEKLQTWSESSTRDSRPFSPPSSSGSKPLFPQKGPSVFTDCRSQGSPLPSLPSASK